MCQLKPDSRVFIAKDPSLAWSVSDRFLRSIEYYAHVLVWQNTKDGQSNSPKEQPEPILASWEIVDKKISSTEGYLTNADLGGNLLEFLDGNFTPVETIVIDEDLVSGNTAITPKELK